LNVATVMMLVVKDVRIKEREMKMENSELLNCPHCGG